VLSAIISDMRVKPNGEITLFLDRPPLMIALASGQFSLQLARAARVLDLWHRHRELIAMIDMTTSGEAIVHPSPETALSFDAGSGDRSRRPPEFNSIAGIKNRWSLSVSAQPLSR
jgi:hypothetical protein